MRKEDYDIGPMDKGYVQIYTGDGKGKSTAALGLAMRAVGAGLRVYIGQFIKDMEYSEIPVIRERFPEIEVELFGQEKGCIVDRDVEPLDRESAAVGLAAVRTAMLSGKYDIVIGDEINVAVTMGVISEEEILELLADRPDRVELILTGRGATEQMIEAADLVSEMVEVKHYYKKGVTSREGIEC